MMMTNVFNKTYILVCKRSDKALDLGTFCIFSFRHCQQMKGIISIIRKPERIFEAFCLPLLSSGLFVCVEEQACFLIPRQDYADLISITTKIRQST